MLSHIAFPLDRPAFFALLVLAAAVGAVLFVPLANHRMSGSERRVSAGSHALFLLYIAAVVAVILWPFPIVTAELCKPHRIASSAQLVPFQFVAHAFREAAFDSWASAIRVAGEASANSLLFVPLGMYLRSVLRWRIRTILAIAAAFAMLLELTQLTGVWGAYPCAYRRFDVDDVIMNSAGAVVGAGFASCLDRIKRGLDPP
jgi:glycopeptide antibiotics resistance protein